MKNKETYIRLLRYFPPDVRGVFSAAADGISGRVNEIRLYLNAPVVFMTDCGARFPDASGFTASFPSADCIRATAPLMRAIILNASGASPYAREKELNDGYITLENGIRIGICAFEPDKTFSPDRISSMNIRLPYEKITPAPAFIKELAVRGGLLIAGAPGSGKTTLLKACCRELCDMRSGGFKRVSIIDSRGELSVFGGGEVFFAADCVFCRSRAEGIQRALRLMSPEYILCDETGSCEETRLILEGLNSGVKFIAAMHAGNIGELAGRGQFRALFSENAFVSVVMLSGASPGEIAGIYGREELKNEIHKYDADLHGDNSCRT